MNNPPFLNNVSIRSRLLLSISLFCATLVFSMISAYNSIGSNIAFATQEMKGNLYQRPLADLLDAVSQLRAARPVANPNPQRDQTLAMLDKAFLALEKAQSVVGEDLQFTEVGLKSRNRENLKLETVKRKEAALKQKITTDEKGAWDEEAAALVTDLRGMISHSGDTSNLILDPDLDSYYLMDVTLLALPQTMDRMGAIAAEIIPLLSASGTLDEAARTRAAVLAKMLEESDLMRITGDMDTSLKEDLNFYGVNPRYQAAAADLVKKYSASSQALIDSLNTLAAKGSIKPEAFRQTTQTAQMAAHTFLIKAYDHLDDLLTIRMNSYRGDQMKSIGISTAGILISLFFFFVIVRTITAPLGRLTHAMLRLAHNERGVEIDYTEARSEIGEIAASVQVFKDNILKMEQLQNEQIAQEKRAKHEHRLLIDQLVKSMEASVGEIANTINGASIELQHNAINLSDSAEKTSKTAATVSEASQHTSVNVQVVASSAEELTASIGEISAQIQESSDMIANAIDVIRKTDATVAHMTDSSRKIGDVVQLIQDIAGQTNLLALNATIEAARAGEAGKGFAVVASEVKSLATQTEHATKDITINIAAMQTETNKTIDAIKTFDAMIDKIGEASHGIASAVTEQTAATQEIARNIQQVSASSTEITNHIASVSQATDVSKKSVQNVLEASTQMAKQALTLKDEIQSFVAKMKAS